MVKNTLQNKQTKPLSYPNLNLVHALSLSLFLPQTLYIINPYFAGIFLTQALITSVLKSRLTPIKAGIKRIILFQRFFHSKVAQNNVSKVEKHVLSSLFLVKNLNKSERFVVNFESGSISVCPFNVNLKITQNQDH